MAVQLVLTEEMIDCFHSCAEKRDYQKLFKDYPTFFVKLVEKLEKVKFPDGSICKIIAKNSEHFLNVLRLWHSGDLMFSEDMLGMVEQFPEFISHFLDLDLVKNWNYFYMKYNSTADIMITCARNEGVLDFKIECKGMIFDSFEKRDKFLEHGQKLKNELIDEIKRELKLSEAKIEEDRQKLRNELMDRFASLELHMENRISETNEKIESMNRKLAHFNSSFNEKFNSLGEQLSSHQLVEKIEETSTLKNNGDELNQFLDKIGKKFGEQQDEMKLRADWMDRKMDKMMEMMVQNTATVGSARPDTLTVQDNTIGTRQNVSLSESDPTDDIVGSPIPAISVDEPTSEDEELQKMEEELQKALAEQNCFYEEKLRIAKEKRREMNERAEEERRQISGNLTASF